MKLLIELLALEAEPEGILSGVEKIVDRAKKGFNRAKDMHKKKESELKDAEKAAKDAEKEAEQKIKDAEKRKEDAEKYAEKEAKEAGKAAEAEHKLKSAESMSALKDEIEDFISDFFTNFPNKDAESVEKIMERYPTLEAAKEAFKSFKAFGERFDDLRKGFNSALVKQGKVKRETVDRHIASAKRIVADKRFDGDFIQFVRRESKFFKRLVQVTDDFKLNDTEFKELLGLKIKQTDPARVGDAAGFLNILFMHASAQFAAHARLIGAVGKNLQDASHAADREARDRARAAKAAATPDPTD